MVISPQGYINQWLDPIAGNAALRDKVVAALKLLDANGSGAVTMDELVAWAESPDFAARQGGAYAAHFYAQALSHEKGACRRAWVHQQLPEISVEALADVVAFLPQQASQTKKPFFLGVAFSLAGDGLVRALNAKLASFEAPTMDAEILPQVYAQIGTAIIDRGVAGSDENPDRVEASAGSALLPTVVPHACARKSRRR